MCGIAGIVYKKNGNQPPKVLKSFLQSLSHRGPDDHGAVTSKKTSLVQTRLSIIDVEGGHQPLESEKGELLVGNGEIYNYVELKKEHSSFPYKCSTDMEVVFPLYHKSGGTFAEHLRGMYALALYDEGKDHLILSRDPYGIKPLYYVETESYFAFASEIQALVKAGLVQPELNTQARDEAIQLRFSTGANTCYRGVTRVLPGETLIIENGTIINRYLYNVLDQKTVKWPFEQALDHFDKVMSESVKIHLRSDVPYGIFLSGGLDSAAVLKLMQRHTNKPIESFTIGFDKDSVHDERVQAAFMASAVGAHHHEMHFTETDFWEYLPEVVKHIDDPIFDQAMLPTYKLAHEAAKKVKVVLCGEGGDEMLAGYRRYQKAKLPEWLGGRLIRKKGVFHNLDPLFKSDISFWRLGLEELKEAEDTIHRTKVQVSQAVDCRSWLVNNLLIKLDRCLMAHGLEGRTPFLDPVVTEATYALEDSLKIKKGYGKFVLRKWLEKNFPEARPFDKKRGFRVPVADWLLAKKMSLATLMAKQEALKPLCHMDAVQAFYENLTRENEFAAWSLLVYALWHKHHIQGIALKGDTFSSLSMEG